MKKVKVKIKDNYDFHLVLNSEMKGDINKLNEILVKYGYIRCKSTKREYYVSPTVLFILRKMDFKLDEFCLTGEDEGSRQDAVGWDTDMKVYFNKDHYDIYYKLKMIHFCNNTNSMAKILRQIIRYFINGVKKYGLVRFLSVLEDMEEDFRNQCNKKTNNKEESEWEKEDFLFIFELERFTPFIIHVNHKNRALGFKYRL